MKPETIHDGINALRQAYGEAVQVAVEGARTLVRIRELALFPGCRPPETDFLLVLDLAQAKPLHFVLPGQTLRSGKLPKNHSDVVVGGEAWMTFSYNIPFQENDSMVAFLHAIRLRFDRDE